VATDLSALTAAIIGVVGGAVATGIGSLLRLRTSERTAARLIFAELARSSAAVAYFRSSGTWTDVAVTRTAWDKFSETLARARRSDVFEKAQRGYAAVDSVAFLAANPNLDEAVSKRLLNENIDWLVKALHILAVRAKTRGADEVTRRLTLPFDTQYLQATVVGTAPPSLLTQIFDMQVAAGEKPGPALDRTIEPDLRAWTAIAKSGHRLEDADIRIYDAGGTSDQLSYSLPLVRTTRGGRNADETVERVFEACAVTWEFYRDVLGRESIDGKGGPVNAVVHYGQNYANVFWDGERLVVGDGDSSLFSDFSRHVDVLAHELSHVVTEQAGLVYKGQSGALSESYCDVMGLLVKQWSLGHTATESSWLIGEGLLLPAVPGQGLRSLKAPGSAYGTDSLGSDPQPSHMSEFVKTQSDNGGAHINSGIPSRAFYLAAVTVGGPAWETIGMVWYHTMVGGTLTTSPSFSAFAHATLATARQEFPGRRDIESAVAEGWRAVGVKPRTKKETAAVPSTVPTDA
jgi:hypothetical protein